MRRMSQLLLVCWLCSPVSYAQQYYTEAGCILLLDQMHQFSANPQRASYRDAKRQYDNYCQKLAAAPTAGSLPAPRQQPDKAGAGTAKPQRAVSKSAETKSFATNGSAVVKTATTVLPVNTESGQAAEPLAAPHPTAGDTVNGVAACNAIPKLNTPLTPASQYLIWQAVPALSQFVLLETVWRFYADQRPC